MTHSWGMLRIYKLDQAQEDKREKNIEQGCVIIICNVNDVSLCLLLCFFVDMEFVCIFMTFLFHL